MIILKNYSLKKYNTFGLDVKAASLLKVKAVDDLKQALKLTEQPIFILGGGSNMLLTQDIKGLVIKNELEGCLLYTSPSPRDQRGSRMPSSA